MQTKILEQRKKPPKGDPSNLSIKDTAEPIHETAISKNLNSQGCNKPVSNLKSRKRIQVSSRQTLFLTVK